MNFSDFDTAHDQALRSIWFAGDVHGEFKYIKRALQTTNKEGRAAPRWLVFLGDQDLEERPFRDEVQEIQELCPGLRVAFIHGNHDSDTHEKWELLHDSGPAIALHGQVVELGGIRVAGLGGNFMGRIWAPPSQPTFASRSAAMKRGPYAWRENQRPNPKLNGAIYPEDVDRLAAQRADVLVTHEAPSCHPYGWAALDDLARVMGVKRTFHGHTHDDLSEQYRLQSDEIGFDAIAVNYCCIKNGLGEFIYGPQPRNLDWK